ncbi:MAG: PadR family transcriptional regulator, partial [Sciscionella sp.]|nr:PadR family transcriptional regulator [Sciscionella sp.]
MARQVLTPLALEVLGLLSERPMHPYEMQQLMRDRRADMRVKVKAGSLYHTVQRLVDVEYVSVVDTQREGRRPERTVYALTDAGWDAFTDRVKGMLATPAEEYPEYPVALAAMNDIGVDDAARDDVIHQLEMRIINLEGNAAKYQAALDHVLGKKLPRLYWLEHEFRYEQLKTELRWTKKLV